MAPSGHIAIIGAGVSGLTVAYELSKQGYEVSVFEEQQQVGGLARSTMLDGHPVDRYYHFICSGDDHLKGLIDELGLADKLHWRVGLTSYYVDGKLYPFTTPLDILLFSPISIVSRIRFGLHGARARRFTHWESLEDITAEDWLVDGMGRQAYETIWLPLLQMKFGQDAGDVSAPWMWHRIHRVITSRKSILRPEQLGYMADGSTTLLSGLVEALRHMGASLHLAQPVRELVAGADGVRRVVTDQADIPVDAVVSTVPLPVLRDILPRSAADYRAELARTRFLGVICLLARLHEPLTSSFWVNANDARAPFSGFIEYANLNPCPGLAGDALLYVPLYMPTDDPRFGLSDSEFAQGIIEGLTALFPQFDASGVHRTMVTRDAHAQAFCPPGFRHRIPSMQSPLPGLFLTDSTQLYPADRNISGMIGLARQAAHRCAACLDPSPSGR